MPAKTLTRMVPMTVKPAKAGTPHEEGTADARPGAGPAPAWPRFAASGWFARLTARLAGLDARALVVVTGVIAVAFSEAVAAAVSLIMIGEVPPVMWVAAFVTPAVVAPACAMLLVAVIRSLRREVAERALLTRELARSEERYRTIVDTSQEGIWLIDAEARTTFVNTRMADMLGYTVDEMLGRTMFDFMDAAGCEEARRNFARRKAGIVEQHDFRLQRRDGSDLWTSMAASPVTDRAGRIVGALAMVCDISERRRAEKAERRARRDAETANRAKSDFIANTSHELRTPLNAIIGFSEMIKDCLFGPIGNPKYAEYAEYINESGRHLLSILNDILDLSKVEAGRAELDEESFDIDEAVTACLTLVKPRAERERLSLSKTVAPGLPPVRGDERKIKQVLVNLLGNAVKFTAAGGRVSVDVSVDGDGGLEIAVSDTGVGMAPADIPKAMTPFTQVDSRIERKSLGTGLGLPLAKAFAELHGGGLRLTSAPGRGTTATLRLPPERLGRSAA